MQLSILAIACLALVASAEDLSWDSGAPCSSQHDMRPSAEQYGTPIDGIEPPYHLTVSDANGARVKYYAPGNKYTGRI